MVNESVRTRQYREYLDADKHISRQIYNLYQRQESAYNEGTPSIRNQNQLAPISGVIEAVNAFQMELQTLLGNTANAYLQTSQNFIPTVKTYNALVFALRSIQNIYTKDVQIKYEVDKLLRPVVDLLQSLGSQLAFDPAVSNRLFQMRMNLLSKVYERVDFNVGKRTTIKSEGNTNTINIQTSQPNSGQEDTFQAPIQYNPVSNDPFLGKEALKSEPPATLYGLATDGIDLSEQDNEILKTKVDAIQQTENMSPTDYWKQTDYTESSILRLNIPGAVSYELKTKIFKDDEDTENIKRVINKNQEFFNTKRKALSELLTKGLNDLRKIITSKRQQEEEQKRKDALAKKSERRAMRRGQNPPEQEQQPTEAEMKQMAQQAKEYRKQMPAQQLTPAKALTPKQMKEMGDLVRQQGLDPIFTPPPSSSANTTQMRRIEDTSGMKAFTPPARAQAQPTPPSQPQDSVSFDDLDDDQLKARFTKNNAKDVYSRVRRETKGYSWADVLNIIRQQYSSNPIGTAEYLNTEYNMNLTIPIYKRKK